MQTSPRGGGPSDPELAAFLADCADVLASPGYDPEHLEGHAARIEALVQAGRRASDLVSLLEEVRPVIERLRSSPIAFLEMSSKRLDELSAALMTAANDAGWRPYLYHGTVFARLPQIHREGLKPGEVPVWRTERLLQRCSEAVFFAVGWRSAANFASYTSARTRGPKDGPGRRPVVLRLPAGGLDVEVDTWATTDGCRMVRGSVPMAGADVFLPPLHGVPTWRPLAEVVAERKR
jgi:hypothetical protein